MHHAFVLWRRLDAPGSDACRLERSSAGWRLEGTAVFRRESDVAHLAYRVECRSDFLTQRGRVRGWIGAKPVEHVIVRTPSGVWTVNGDTVPGVEGCIDLDLGFTPATNLIPLRRLALDPGRAAEAPAAWLEASAGRLELLPQRYKRRSEATYWYEAPSVDYAALLEVAPSGFVLRYPGLWEAEASSGVDN
jgi:hypothetical protein